MKWASAISRNTAFDSAVSECTESLNRELGGATPDIIFAFVTPHFAASFGGLHDAVRRDMATGLFVGCTGGGVLGAGREIEAEPAISFVAASLPGVGITPFHIGADASIPDLDGPPDSWVGLTGIPPDDSPAFVIFSDPFFSQTEAILSGLDYAYPSSAKVGGLVSGGTSSGTNNLFLDEELYSGGMIGVALSGDIRVDTVVAQGCRPIGDLMTVTSCQGNYLYELDGSPALEAVRNTFSELEPQDLELARSALFVGILMDEFTENPGPGDFLIRNVIGFDPSNGTIVVGERLQPGTRLHLHVRDARTSAEDLGLLLDLYSASVESPPDGTLLFSCLGRGANLYGQPDFDSSLLATHVGDIPVGGFFCNGEIGPVKGSTFLHGYTSSIALFRPKSP